jgi:transcription initiation factor TFIIIB Brf1 subunit/transcription initiation factor TFIIB
MEQCPKCGKYMMSYWVYRGQWECFNCKTKIPEICEDYLKRLREANKQGRHYIEPPL